MRQNAFPFKDVPSGGLDNILLHLGGKTLKKLPKMGGNRHFAAKLAK